MIANTIGLEILREKWADVAALAGIVLVITLALLYEALWKPREEERRKEQIPLTSIRGFFSWLLGIMPWILIVSIAVVAAYAVIHTIMAMLTPPNW